MAVVEAHMVGVRSRLLACLISPLSVLIFGDFSCKHRARRRRRRRPSLTAERRCVHIQLGVAHALLLFVARFTQFGDTHTAHLNLVCRKLQALVRLVGEVLQWSPPQIMAERRWAHCRQILDFSIQLANCCSHSMYASSFPHILSHALSFFSRRAGAVAPAGAPIGPRPLSLSQ